MKIPFLFSRKYLLKYHNFKIILNLRFFFMTSMKTCLDKFNLNVKAYFSNDNF